MERSSGLRQERGQAMLRRDTCEPALSQMVDMESLVPSDHVLRKIDAVLDLSFVPDAVAGCYSADRGRPSINPELAVRMMLLGCCTTSVTGSCARRCGCMRGCAGSAGRTSMMLKIAAVPHGFRSSFRDWAAEETDHPREVAEAALAHKVRNQIEAAYRRTDLFERRRRLMDDWARYLAGEG